MELVGIGEVILKWKSSPTNDRTSASLSVRAVYVPQDGKTRRAVIVPSKTKSIPRSLSEAEVRNIKDEKVNEQKKQNKTMKKTTSTFKPSTIGSLFFLVPVTLVMLYFLLDFTLWIVANRSIADAWVILIFGGFSWAFLKLLRDVKFLIIKRNKVVYYSCFRPLGEAVYFSDYVGYVIVHNQIGFYNPAALYLIDKENRTTFKIRLPLYKQYNKMVAAIPLKKNDYFFTRAERRKLMYGGSVVIDRNSNDNRI